MRKAIVALALVAVGLPLLPAQVDNSNLTIEPYYWRQFDWYYDGFEVANARAMLAGTALNLVDYTSRLNGWNLDVVWFGGWFKDYRSFAQASDREKASKLAYLTEIRDEASVALASFMKGNHIKEYNYYAIDLIQAIANLQLCAEVLRDSYDQYVVCNGYKGASYIVSYTNAPSKVINRILAYAPGYLFQSVWYILEGTPTSGRLREHAAMRSVYSAFDKLCSILTAWDFLEFNPSSEGKEWGSGRLELTRYGDEDFPLK